MTDYPNNIGSGIHAGYPGTGVTRIVGGGGGEIYNVNYFNTTTGAFQPDTLDNSQLVRVPASGVVTSYQRLMPDGGKEIYALSNGATTYPRLMFLTSIVDPAGNTTTLTYDSSFRLTAVTDAMGRYTSFTYGLSATPLLITKIKDYFGRTSTITYDSSNRLSTITDPVNITSTLTYGESAEPNFVSELTTPYGNSFFNDTNGSNEMRTLLSTDPLGYSSYFFWQLNNQSILVLYFQYRYYIYGIQALW